MQEDEFSAQRQAAIEAALNNNWPEAVSINEALLKDSPKEIETLNRLARAYMENGLVGKSKTTYKYVLELDPYNSIAAKNLEKLTGLTKKDIAQAKTNSNGAGPISADLFLEEPGRTKVIELQDLAMSKILATLHTGDPVTMETKGSEVMVTLNNKRLGKLPPQYAEKISQAIKAGSKFTAIIKAVSVNRHNFSPKKQSLRSGGLKLKNGATVTLFVRESVHAPKLGGTPIFQSNNNHLTSFVREDTLPLMDTRSGLVVETDDETLGDSTSITLEEHEEDSPDEHGPVLEDEE